MYLIIPGTGEILTYTGEGVYQIIVKGEKIKYEFELSEKIATSNQLHEFLLKFDALEKTKKSSTAIDNLKELSAYCLLNAIKIGYNDTDEYQKKYAPVAFSPTHNIILFSKDISRFDYINGALSIVIKAVTEYESVQERSDIINHHDTSELKGSRRVPSSSELSEESLEVIEHFGLGFGDILYNQAINLEEKLTKAGKLSSTLGCKSVINYINVINSDSYAFEFTQQEISESFLQDMSDQSIGMIEKFGLEAPRMLNEYCIALEDIINNVDNTSESTAADEITPKGFDCLVDSKPVERAGSSSCVAGMPGIPSALLKVGKIAVDYYNETGDNKFSQKLTSDKHRLTVKLTPEERADLWKAGKLDVDHYNKTGEIKTPRQINSDTNKSNSQAHNYFCNDVHSGAIPELTPSNADIPLGVECLVNGIDGLKYCLAKPNIAIQSFFNNLPVVGCTDSDIYLNDETMLVSPFDELLYCQVIKENHKYALAELYDQRAEVAEKRGQRFKHWGTLGGIFLLNPLVPFMAYNLGKAGASRGSRLEELIPDPQLLFLQDRNSFLAMTQAGGVLPRLRRIIFHKILGPRGTYYRIIPAVITQDAVIPCQVFNIDTSYVLRPISAGIESDQLNYNARRMHRQYYHLRLDGSSKDTGESILIKGADIEDQNFKVFKFSSATRDLNYFYIDYPTDISHVF